MKKSYHEGLAHYMSRESCLDGSQGRGEALTVSFALRASAGQGETFYCDPTVSAVARRAKGENTLFRGGPVVMLKMIAKAVSEGEDAFDAGRIKLAWFIGVEGEEETFLLESKWYKLKPKSG